MKKFKAPYVSVDKVLMAYPRMNELSINYIKDEAEREFKSFGLDINDKVVIPIDVFKKFVKHYNEICKAIGVKNLAEDDFGLDEICKCSVCDKLLMWNDEAYNDGYTGQVLCDSHSIFEEDSDFYVKSL